MKMLGFLDNFFSPGQTTKNLDNPGKSWSGGDPREDHPVHPERTKTVMLSWIPDHRWQ